jgi:thioredoxin-related protein
MKKSALFISYLLSVIQLALAQNRTIHFEKGTWAEIQAQAQKENKQIFVDAYTTWCGPCKWLAKNVFTNDTIADYYNAHFINASVDMEKGEAIELRKKWGVNAYPSLLFFSPQGNILHRTCGAMSVSDFLKLAEDAINPEKQIATAQKKYEGGNVTPDFLADFISRLSELCIPFEKESKQYFATQKLEDLSNKRNWSLIKSTVSDIDSREFKYVEQNQSIFEKLYDAKEVTQKVTDVYTNALMSSIYKDTTTGYKAIKSKLLSTQNPSATKAVAYTDLNYYSKQKDWPQYALSATRYIVQYDSTNAGLLNEVAWTFYENMKDKKELVKALAWAKKSITIEEVAETIDTYASLLFATGDRKTAIAEEKRAVALAKEKGNESLTTTLQKTLKKFQEK